MATTLNISLEDEVFERARSRKETLGLTWAGVIKHFAREADEPTTSTTRSLEDFVAEDDARDATADDDAGAPGSTAGSTTLRAEDLVDLEDDIDLDVDADGVFLDLPGSGDLLEQRQEAVLAMWELLVEEGTATRKDFLELVDPDQVGYETAESFWANAVKGRDSLRALPGVETPSTGRSEWQFTDP